MFPISLQVTLMHKDRASLIFQYLHLKKVCDNLNRIAESQTLFLQLSSPSSKPFQSPTALYPPLLEQSYTG